MSEQITLHYQCRLCGKQLDRGIHLGPPSPGTCSKAAKVDGFPWTAPLGHCLFAQKCLSTPFHCDAKRTSGCFSGGPFLIQVQASISSSGTR